MLTYFATDHDDASVTASAYSFFIWDNHTAILDPHSKAVLSTPASLPLSRLTSKLQILEKVLSHDGVLLMNGPPVTRTFREAALRAGPSVMAEVEAEQEK